MNKSILFTIALTLITLAAKAQHPERAQVVVHYKLTHIRDTNNRAHPYTENMALYIGKNASVYKSYEGILEDARFKKAFEEALAKSPDGRATVNRIYTGSSTEYYVFPNEQKFFTIERILSNVYVVEDPVPAINWKISGETATFGSLRCQKATCHFKGRDYTAWFCPDLPVHTGPWKLDGLPGVIVDAHDAKNEVVFKFDGAEKAVSSPPKGIAPANGKKPLPMPGNENSNADPNLIGLPANAIKTTQKQFDKLSVAMRKDPNAFAQAISAGQSGGAKMDVKVGAGKGPVINNPIELPEKK